MPYRAPVEDFRFLLEHVVGLTGHRDGAVRRGDAGRHRAILTEAGRMCEEVLAPLQRTATCIPRGWKTAWCAQPRLCRRLPAIAEGGWVSISAAPSMAAWACRWR